MRKAEFEKRKKPSATSASLAYEARQGVRSRLSGKKKLVDRRAFFAKAWPPKTCPRPSDPLAPRGEASPLTRGDSQAKGAEGSVGTDEGIFPRPSPAPACRGWDPGTPALVLVRPCRS